MIWGPSSRPVPGAAVAVYGNREDGAGLLWRLSARVRERWIVEIDTGPPTPRKLVRIVLSELKPPRVRCPLASRPVRRSLSGRGSYARRSWVLVSLAWVPGNFSPRHVPGGRGHCIQFLDRPLSS